MLNKIFAVSFPRSGSTLMKDILAATIGDEFRWVDVHQNPPCEEHNYIKTHDFDLDATPPDGVATIVQYRNPLDAITSWFDLECSAYGRDDTYASWVYFAKEKLEFYNKWTSRWLRYEYTLIPHGYLVEAPSLVVSGVLKLMGWNGEPKMPGYPLRPPSCHRNFRYNTRVISEA